MLEHVDHIAIATRNIDSAVDTLRKLGPVTLGELEIVERYKLKARMVKAGGVPIELIEPLNDDSTIAAFIEKRGEGLHHIAYRVANVASALDVCRAQGFKPIDEQPRPGYAESRVAFLHPKSVLGMLTELVERQPGKDTAPYAPEHQVKE
jgi:methylmalonyl-CoA/ethylmalonyl-CoA epimerase